MRAEVIKLANAGKLDDAAALAVKELAVNRDVRGELHEDIVNSLGFLARLQEAREDRAAARKALEEVLAVRQRQPDQKDWRIADARRALADLDCRAALDPAQRRRLSEADQHMQAAIALRGQGKYAAGVGPCRRAMEIRGELLGENHPDYAQSLNTLAALYEATGDYAKAEPLCRQALEINKRALGENHPNYASSLNNLAELYRDMGDYGKAEPLFRQALESRKRARRENHPNYAYSLNGLALLYQHMGDYGKAEPLFRQALESQKRARRESHPDYAASLNNLAVLYRDMGDYAKAEPLFRQALESQKRALGENHPNYASSLNNLAELYRDMGDYVKAEPLFRQALEIDKRALGENHPNYASSLNNLGLLYDDMGEYAKAGPLSRQALEITKRAVGENHPNYAYSLGNLASLYQHMGDYAKAEQLLGQGLTCLTRWTHGGLAMLGERQRIRLVTAQGGALNGYLSVAPGAGIRVEEIYRHVLAWKGVVEARQDEDHLARDQPELKETLSQLEQARARLARLAFTAPPAGRRQAWLEQLDALRDRKENLESDVARKSGAFRQVQEGRRLGAAEVAASLPAGNVLVDLLDYNHVSPPEGGKGKFGFERRLVAFVLRRGQAPVLMPLGASRPINEAARAWRQALVAGTPARMQTAAVELSRRVWEPLKPHLEGATSILVAPDGPLAYFPLAALPGHRPGTYLVEDLAIGYVSSARRLVETLAAPSEGKPKSPEAQPAGLLAIGGIDYKADPGGAAPSESVPTPGVLLAESQRAGFRSLAGTEPEVRRIGQLFEAAFPEQHAVVLTGAAPTEAAVKQQLGRHWRHLHLATHGFFESPARVAAIRAGLKSDGFGLAGVGSSEESASVALSPLLHSGVALVGAARKTQDAGPGAQGSLPDREDGILTAEEVQSFDLRGTEMVVLSACETGLGQGYYGQGVMGLQRAFQAAGARAVVASLWRVDDAATTVLMEQFYTNLWSKKMPKLEALRQAQLTVLNNPGLVTARQAELAKQREIDDKAVKLPNGGQNPAPIAGKTRSDPAFWAAFVLSGDVR
jgi:CHAT domain-containing protein/Tfp pilus assembly protein PilF